MNKLTVLIVSLLSIVLIGITPAQLKAEQDFGRLFSTPAERKKLDLLRQSRQLVIENSQQNMPSASMAPELPEPVTMQGYVKRSDGTTTLWINNKTVQENSTQDQIEIGRLSKSKHSLKDGSESLTVRIPATGKNVHLKAGQVYEPENDRIVELKHLQKEKQLELKETGVISNEAVP